MALTKVSNSMQDSAPLSVFDFIPSSEHAAITNFTSTYDATDDIQAALDEVNNDFEVTSASVNRSGRKLVFPPGLYLISKPLTIKGYGLHLDGGGCCIRKTTNDLPSPALSSAQDCNSNGQIDNNVNAIFLVKDLNRGLTYSVIENFELEGIDGTSNPIGIYWWGNRSIFRNIRMVYVNKGIESPNAYVCQYSHIIVSRTTSHGFHHNHDRLSGTADSGTSVHFDNCYIIDSDAKGYYLETLSYSKFSACAADFCTEESYYFFQCEGIGGNVGFENPFASSTTPAIAFWSNSSGHLSIDSFANQASPYPAAAIYVRESKVTLSGTLRADYQYYVETIQEGIAKLENFKIWPVGGDPDSDLDDLTKFKTTAGSDSYIYYTPAFQADAQRATYIFSDYGITISGDAATWLNEGPQGLPSSRYRYGPGKLRVLYQSDFDTTHSNTFSVPLQEIRRVLPYFDGYAPRASDENGYLHTVLALRIEVDSQVLHGHWVYFRWDASTTSTYLFKDSTGGLGQRNSLELVDNAAGSDKVRVHSISLATVGGLDTLQVVVNNAGQPVTLGASLEISPF